VHQGGARSSSATILRAKAFATIGKKRWKTAPSFVRSSETFLGGVSQMTGEPKTADDEFRMAAAGPFISAF